MFKLSNNDARAIKELGRHNCKAITSLNCRVYIEEELLNANYKIEKQAKCVVYGEFPSDKKSMNCASDHKLVINS